MATNRQNTRSGKWKLCCDFSSHCKWNFDRMFYRLGFFLGLHPVKSIVAAVLLCGLAACGMMYSYEELDDVELFMPLDSPIRDAAAWVNKNFRDDLLFQSVIVEADNVLDRGVLSKIAELEMAVRKININGRGWEDVCARYQSWFEDSDGTSLHTSEFSDILGGLDENTFQNDCIYQSVLKFLVKNDKFDSISKLRQNEILDIITKKFNDSKPKNILEDVSTILSGVEWSPNGTVIGARATILTWMVKKSDNSSSEWELEFLQKILHSERYLPPGIKIFAVCTRRYARQFRHCRNTGYAMDAIKSQNRTIMSLFYMALINGLDHNSYKDVLGQVLESNKTILFAGFSLIIIYVMIMLGRCNVIEQRIFLSLLGVLVVGKSIAASYGICFYMGFFWGPLHPILPFLLLGVGVDNTFVIVQCLDNLPRREKIDIPDRIGRALQQAGVSITVTSLTDILAFAVGTSTVMPFLKSFCVFAAVGILCLYVFEIIFFVSWLALDERRILSNRDCFFGRYSTWIPDECSKTSIQQVVFTKYVAPTMMRKPVKVFILLTAAVIFSFNVWCVLQVERKFDPIWYLNQDSYPIKFNQKLNEYFPQHGKRAGIYMTGINFYEEKDALYELASRLESNPFINKGTLDVWYKAFDKWLTMKNFEPESDEEYKQYLMEFLLLTTQGQAYIKDLRFKNFFTTDYSITAAQIPIQYIVINTTEEQVLAMDSVNQIIQSYNYSNGEQKIVAFSPDYVAWTANKIIGQELLRNLGLTLVAVIIVTMVLIQNLQTAFWVNCCVVFTVVDLVGSMYWLDLTIEISTSLMVLLCAGLAVDYAAHIGHEFTRLPGTKDERAMKTVSLIGSAIFNGGFSTFLAFALLGLSKSYLFITFFKLFTGVVVFGVFHGLFFLPVVLSLFGPEERSPVPQVQDGFSTTRTEEMDDIEQNCLTKTATSSEVNCDTPCLPATSSLMND